MPEFDDLNELAPSVDAAEWRAAFDRRRRQARRRRTGSRLTVAFCVTGLAISGVVLLVNDENEGAQTVIVDQPNAPSSATTSVPGDGGFASLAPGWHELETGPVPPMRGASLTWTGVEVMVTGAGQSFAYDPTTETWRELAPPPFPEEALIRTVAADETVVAVGEVFGQSVTSATYDIATDTWTEHGEVPSGASFAPLPPGEEPVGSGGPQDPNAQTSLLWTGERVFDLTHRAVFDPGSGRWAPLLVPDDLLPFVHLFFTNPVWTGSEVVLVAAHDRPGLAWDATGTSFREVPGLPSELVPRPGFVDATFAVTLDDRIVFATQTLTGDAMALDPESWEWTALPPVPNADPTIGCPFRMGTVSYYAVVAPCGPRGDRGGVPAVFLDGETWQSTGEPTSYPPVMHCCSEVWLDTGNALVSWDTDVNADDDDLTYVRAQVWIPPSDGRSTTTPTSTSRPTDAPDTPVITWHEIDRPPASAGALVARSSEPVAFLSTGEIATLDVESGQWTPIATIPPGYRGGAELVLVDDAQMVVWGGASQSDEAFSDGFVVDLATGQTTAMPEGPIDYRFRGSAVWTGTQLLIWGGADQERLPQRTGAGFDPTTQQWTMIPDGPLSARNDHRAVWTGTEMIIWGGCSDTENIVQCDDSITGDELGDGAAYDPFSRTWRRIASAPFTPRDKAQAIWAGDHMVVIGGRSNADGESPVFAYDPATDEWHDIDSDNIPQQLTGFGLAAIGPDRVLIAGGSSPGGSGDSVFLIDVAGNSTSELTQADWSPRDRIHMIAIDDTRVLLVGGCCSETTNFLNDAYIGEMQSEPPG